jgi:hypothetical protein
MSVPFIVGQIVGSELVVAKLAQISVARRNRVRATVNALGVALHNLVVSKYLNGPRPGHLGVGKTGLLWGSINDKPSEDGNSFSSSVGTNVPYGAYWEKGFDRKIGAGARGGPSVGPRLGPGSMTDLAKVKYFAKHPPGTKHEDARPFLTPALADMKDDIRARLAGAMGGS